MIRYTLKCAHGHHSESWFQSAEAYDRLAVLGQLSCGICGSTEVEKALMAPAVPPKGRSDTAQTPAVPAQGGPVEAPAPGPAPMPAPVPGAVLSAPSHPMEAALRALRAKVEATAENVGRDFPDVARAMHLGDEETRPVYGEATGQEAQELIEDGVPVSPLPWFGRRND
ncbi:MAG: DUF1178 family protein [Pseudomonadota bacterium]